MLSILCTILLKFIPQEESLWRIRRMTEFKEIWKGWADSQMPRHGDYYYADKCYGKLHFR